MHRLLSVQLGHIIFSCYRFSSRICCVRENNWFYTKDNFVAGLKAPAKLYTLNFLSKSLQIIGSDFLFHTIYIAKE